MQQPTSLEGWTTVPMQTGDKAYLNSAGSEIWAPPSSARAGAGAQSSTGGKPRPMCGTLRVGVVDAKLAGAKEQDSLVVIATDQHGKLVRKAQTDPRLKTNAPSWFEYFDVSVDYGRFAHLSIRQPPRGLLRFGKGEEFARGVVDLTPLLDGTQHDVRLNLVPAGQIHLKLFFSDESGMFGLDLAATVRREKRTNINVPFIIEACVTHVEKNGLDNVGMYRICGTKTAVDALRARFNQAGAQTKFAFGEDEDINNVGSLLKQYLRELPEPLFTYAKFHDFVAAVNMIDRDLEAKKDVFRQLIHSLPIVNRQTIVYLMLHLSHLANNCNENKMTPTNIGTCFGPSVLAPPPPIVKKGSKPQPADVDMATLAAQAGIVKFIIEHWADLAIETAPARRVIAASNIPAGSPASAAAAAAVGASVPPKPEKPSTAGRPARGSLKLPSSEPKPTSSQFSASDSIQAVLFLKYDKDKSQSLDKKEFSALCGDLGLNAEEANQLMADVDVNRDGNISFDEFQGLTDKIEVFVAASQGFRSNNKRALSVQMSASSELEAGVTGDQSPESVLTRAAVSRAQSVAEMSPEEEAEEAMANGSNSIRALFQRYDEDGSGSIGASELGKLLYDAGHRLTDDELKFAVQRLANKENEITFSAFAEWWAKDDKFRGLHLTDTQLEHLHRAAQYFQHFDVDMSGVLSREEFSALYADLSHYGLSLPSEKECFLNLDKDRDNTVSFNEYVQWLLEIGSLELSEDLPNTSV
ncbi:hypothetical protein CAOG_06882 [Capsaspora owczarzaki ATCC 30864]|uniref:Calmodulin n=1 Tax=Capsaspora owczarzaki (strain ATCC 30864) TaxID=595528 RepID=A0A0D2X4S7_CAPO3|nr:hypothetical protein CAOG_06882 [Capsaspora owczarzaki ATCC 30864]KJE96579.1 hypothetical protein CAOG_006882 [Capsaspora owczarzaki ATCC 30864]|eukprot:XP_004344503.2 hypothetical protein CAOG_06882 [Capsaspora owczarzaki ATCC 30864]